ncbi:hypothetical protein ECP03022936_1331 [Escherichia coli P0302293.6]|nr:hypothetical protein ECP030229310_1267 [Escherichia coli P0302293.10]ENE37247.1 hypothetical protein ECP03022936_1331 [Escherichia coli P0302293.6]
MSRRVTTDKDTDKDTDQEDQNTMVHGVKNATNQAGDVQTVIWQPQARHRKPIQRMR